jgi:hypothetical protein
MTKDEVTATHSDLIRRAEACEMYAATTEISSWGGVSTAARCNGEAYAYRHAASLLALAETEHDTIRALLGAAARGKLPRCECCSVRLATVDVLVGGTAPLCDTCLAIDAAAYDLTRDQWRDLPHADALRAAAKASAK